MAKVLDGLAFDTSIQGSGVLVYQEQVIQIAHTYAGFTMAQADNLRRALAWKKLAVMRQMEKDFKAGAILKGIEERAAMKIWHLLLTFGSCSFNKSHAAAYALISYQAAWLNAHYPVEYEAVFIKR